MGRVDGHSRPAYSKGRVDGRLFQSMIAFCKVATTGSLLLVMIPISQYYGSLTQVFDMVADRIIETKDNGQSI